MVGFQLLHHCPAGVVTEGGLRLGGIAVPQSAQECGCFSVEEKVNFCSQTGPVLTRLQLVQQAHLYTLLLGELQGPLPCWVLAQVSMSEAQAEGGTSAIAAPHPSTAGWNLGLPSSLLPVEP